MQQASYLERGPLIWILPLYLHINQISDDDGEDDDEHLKSSTPNKNGVLYNSSYSLANNLCYGPSVDSPWPNLYMDLIKIISENFKLPYFFPLMPLFNRHPSSIFLYKKRAKISAKLA